MPVCQTQISEGKPPAVFAFYAARRLLWKLAYSLLAPQIGFWGSLPQSLLRVRSSKLAELLGKCIILFKLVFNRNKSCMKNYFLQGALCFISLKWLETICSVLYRYPLYRQVFKVFQVFSEKMVNSIRSSISYRHKTEHICRKR